ncbi:glycerophosphodiester phosphodiesterase [Nocardioides yefusunii]|uniref:Glycerophosphodiester phosphodiesterase n=1 Tax=Nocardioides yefusunii TaxID=2500546 RepID=A0ABW1R1R8_9ACTN|nr:glycerophosphodiester phosphodiesterase family protein [Nocardioides yefusunii]
MRPQVVAHRGASFEKAEHTLGAYIAALDAGAEGLECDVRLTADGHLVCFHDRDLRRTGQTKGVVSTKTLADLDQLDFTAWKNPWGELDEDRFDADRSHRSVLTLRRLFETVRDYPRRVEIAVETKHPVRYGSAVERKLVELLREFGWDGPDSPVRVMSFSWTALQRVERLAPDVRLVQLIEKAHLWPMLRRVIGPDWIVGPGVKELRAHPGLAKRLVASGRDIHVWTVNSRKDLDLCLSLGVKAVISDRPGYMLELLDG